MSTISPEPRKLYVPPIDWGIAWALTQWRAALVLALPVIALEGGAQYLLYSRPLAHETKLTIEFITLGGRAWLLSALIMLCIEDLRGTPGRLSTISGRVLVYLPKVFFSYLLITLITAFFVFAPPLVLFAIFLIWAPAFCAAETYAPIDDPDPESDTFDERLNGAGHKNSGDIYERHAAGRVLAGLKGSGRPRARLFTHRPIWDFGIVRSIKFTRDNPGASFRLALLIWLSNVLPAALTGIVGGDESSYVLGILQISLTLFCYAWVGAVCCSTFLQLLPNEAKAEIGIDVYREPSGMFYKENHTRVFFEGRIAPFVIVGLLALICSKVLIDQVKAKTAIPSTALLEVASSTNSEKELKLELKLQDEKNRFRWLDARNFRLAFDAVPKAEKKPADNKPAEPHYLAPSRVVIYDTAGQSLDLENFAPAFVPLKIVLRFSRPGDVPEHGNYSLHYDSLAGISRVLAHGAY